MSTEQLQKFEEVETARLEMERAERAKQEAEEEDGASDKPKPAAAASQVSEEDADKDDKTQVDSKTSARDIAESQSTGRYSSDQTSM